MVGDCDICTSKTHNPYLQFFLAISHPFAHGKVQVEIQLEREREREICKPSKARYIYLRIYRNNKKK